MTTNKHANQQLHTAYTKLGQLRTNNDLNFAKDIAKDIAKDTYGNYIPKPDGFSLFEGAYNFVKELFTGESHDVVRDKADQIIDNVHDSLPKGVEIEPLDN